MKKCCRKHAFFYNIGMGYVSYRGDTFFQQDFIMKGSTLGMVKDLGYDYFLSDHVAFGFQFSLYGGNLRKYQSTFHHGRIRTCKKKPPAGAEG